MSDKSTSGEKNVNAQGYGPIDEITAALCAVIDSWK